MKKIVFSVVLVALVLGVITSLVLMALPTLEARYQPLIVQQLTARLPEAEKKRIYDLIARETPALWDTVPEPLVGRIAKPDITAMQSYAEVKTNNAGMRSSKPYLPKQPGVYRIVCLGDSFAFGEAGKEEDRFCDQIGAWFHDNKVLMDGKPVETLAVGLSSWTIMQEAAYMTSRLTDYDPDLLIVLTVGNDITSDAGVTGAGLLTDSFSTSERHWGSGNFNIMAGAGYGVEGYSALYSDMSVQAQHYWHEGMMALKRLAEVQQGRGKKVLFSVMNVPGGTLSYFDNMYREQFAKARIPAPFFTVTYLRDRDTALPHDGHPNKKGHAMLRDQYLNTMIELGWLNARPIHVTGVSGRGLFALNAKDNPERKVRHQEGYANDLPQAIGFDQFDATEARAVLGGVLREENDPVTGLAVYPWASVRAGFLLRSPDATQTQLKAVIDVPDRAELFPLTIKLDLHGLASESVTVTTPGEQILTVNVPESARGLYALEVLFESDHYFAMIDDHRMKVFRFIRIGWE